MLLGVAFTWGFSGHALYCLLSHQEFHCFCCVAVEQESPGSPGVTQRAERGPAHHTGLKHGNVLCLTYHPTALLRAAPQVPLIVLPAIPVLQLYTPVECTVLPFFLSFCISVQSSPRSGHGAAYHLLLFLFSHCIPD